jgi:hypothetical protein
VNEFATGIGGHCHCACNANHEGSNCDTLISTKFIGVYTGELILNDTQITSPVVFNVAYSLNDSSFLIANYHFINLGLVTDTTSLCVTIRGLNIFLPPWVNGNGCLSLDRKRLTLNYIYQSTSDSFPNNYSFIGIRQ